MNRYLLDTHILLWWLYDDPKLSKQYQEIISDPKNSIFISIASVWEIEIKSAINKLVVDPSYINFIQNDDFSLVSIELNHTLRLRNLPLHHNDPFDRILIAQAQSEKLTLLTVDKSMYHYDVKTC